MDDFAHIVGEDVHFRGRSPPGERGLKSTAAYVNAYGRQSLPTRGAWIEIPCMGVWGRTLGVAPHPGSVD